MCGRYVTRVDAAIERHWSVVEPWPESFESFNVAPSQSVPVIVQREAGRCGLFMRWGLIPFWAKGEPTRYSTINARSETVAEAASYRTAWSRGQRCLFPVLGFYEWQNGAAGKQPYFIRMAGGEPFGLAGLWDSSAKESGEAVLSCTIMTVEANPLLATIHAKRRMPVIVTTESAGRWLAGSVEDARSMFEPFPADQMDAFAVSRRVNSPRNDSKDLIEAQATAAGVPPAGRD